MGASNLMQIDGNSIWTSRPRISRRFRSKPWKITTGMLGASDVAVKTHSEVVSRHQWGHQRAGSSWIPGRIPWGTCWRAWVWNILWARQHESIICLITIVGPPRWCFSASSRGSLSRPWSCWKQQASWRELRCLAVRESPRFGHFWRDDSWHQFPCSASFELLVILKTPELHFFAANSLRIHESISPIKMDGIHGVYFVEKIRGGKNSFHIRWHICMVLWSLGCFWLSVPRSLESHSTPELNRDGLPFFLVAKLHFNHKLFSYFYTSHVCHLPSSTSKKKTTQ